MLPMKLNFSDDDIHVDGLTVDQMNRSVPEFVSQYYIVNKKATEQEKKDAEDFLLWLNTSETGLDYIVNKFAFVPFMLTRTQYWRTHCPTICQLINVITVFWQTRLMQHHLPGGWKATENISWKICLQIRIHGPKIN